MVSPLMRSPPLALAALLALGLQTLAAAQPAPADAPTAFERAVLGGLPDWSGVWFPDLSDQVRQIRANPAPWTPEAAKKIAALVAEETAGRPKGLFINCLPEAMPSWMMISHNAMEALFTQGRVTLLGESDGNLLRRIYTDGRAHGEDPNPTFHGESIGRWEADVLVVDTIAILPQTYIALSEAVGLANNGDMHIIERIHLAGPNVLVDEMEIIAPHVFTAPWRTTRRFKRLRGRKNDIIEGVCLQGFFKGTRDAAGDAVFQPRKVENGNILPDD